MSRRLPSSLRDLGGNGGTTQSFVIPVVQGQNGPEIGGAGTAGLQQQIQSHIAGLINQGLGVVDGEPDIEEPDVVDVHIDAQAEPATAAQAGGREPTLAARVMTMISRPADASGAPVDEGAINANITINANVQPNVTIRIYPGKDSNDCLKKYF